MSLKDKKQIDDRPDMVSIKDISFSYGQNPVLSDISFSIKQGDYLGVVGPNGAGKSTLLKVILGLLTPVKGSVVLFGKNINDFKDWNKIGYVPQKVTSFDENFPATVFEVALMGKYGREGLFHSVSRTDKKSVQTALEQVGMWEYKDRLIGDLSGGQQQRVFIARALATEPEIIFLDEPTVGVDQKTKDEFYALLRKLNKEMHITVVLISHDIEIVTRETEHIACIDRRLVCYGTADEFLSDTKSSKDLGEEVKIIVHGHHH